MIKPWSKVERCLSCGSLKVDHICKCNEKHKDTFNDKYILDKLSTIDDELEELGEYLCDVYGLSYDFELELTSTTVNFSSETVSYKPSVSLKISKKED